MSLDEYQELSGVTVPQSRQSVMTAQLGRMQTLMENFLGFTLDPDLAKTNLYEEVGILPTATTIYAWEASMFDWWVYLNQPNETLNSPDPVICAYRLYRYNEKDKFYHIDPFTNIHAVKLVRDGVTVRTFLPQEYRVRRGRDGWSKYLEDSSFWRGYYTDNDSRLQLAVDADWLWSGSASNTGSLPLLLGSPEAGDGEIEVSGTGDIPDDLKFVMSEMATYYADPSRLLKSEKIGDYSYVRLDDTANRETYIPQLMPENAAVIARYAGPYGSVTRTPTV